MKDLKLWNFVLDNIKKNKKVILTTVLESKGSSPGKAGFKIAVADDRTHVGTIGGGEMEFNLLNECNKLLNSKKKINLHRKLYHSKKVKKLQSGLVCQGAQTNFTLSFSKKDLKEIEFIIKSYEKKEPSILLLSPKGLTIKKNSKNNQHIRYNIESENEWQYEENIGIRDTVYIIGGGHVGLALSNQMELLGFHVVVFDSRADVQTINENKSADEIIITSFDEIGSYIEEGDYSYAAIVTSALPTDKTALKQIINKKLKYIGLMGSDAKLKRIFNELEAEGIKKTLLKKVEAPIGLKINSNTVEEIAVSIAAQIIKVKNFNK
jgi:xanthine dehydrogenase accessory factor